MRDTDWSCSLLHFSQPTVCPSAPTFPSLSQTFSPCPLTFLPFASIKQPALNHSNPPCSLPPPSFTLLIFYNLLHLLLHLFFIFLMTAFSSLSYPTWYFSLFLPLDAMSCLKLTTLAFSSSFNWLVILLFSSLILA